MSEIIDTLGSLIEESDDEFFNQFASESLMNESFKEIKKNSKDKDQH